MITKKLWNSLSPSKRKGIVDIAFFNMGEEFKREMSKEFYHNFDYVSKGSELDGHWYKLLFSMCTLQKDRIIKITINYVI